MRQIAVIGLSPTTHDDAPFDDARWEKWGLPWDEGYWRHYDRLFEMHDLSLIETVKDCRPHDYLDRLNDVDVPLYMQDAYSAIGPAEKYPFDSVARVTGDYFNSSIAYMLAMAISERPAQIGIWGVDMRADEEFAYQRPNLEYLIGLAKGLGIPVFIPEASPLLKFNGEGIRFGSSYPTYSGRYGQLAWH